MCDENGGLEINCADGGDSGGNGERGSRDRKKRNIVCFILLAVILLLILLCFRSCRAGEPVPDAERVYEEDHRGSGSVIPAAENGRLNLAVSECYHITDEEPCFYIGFPVENVYDVVFTLKNADGNELYRTDYVSAGTNVSIDGTAFLHKGEQKVDCLVSIYDHNSGSLVSSCTTIVLNISYQ